jgi:ubiquitin-protein ligase E3 C
MFFGGGDDKRRRINLGGASSAVSQASILDQAKARRLEREANKQRQDAAVKIQSLWRGVRTRAAFRQEMRDEWATARLMHDNVLSEAERDTRALRALRTVVVLRDEGMLHAWVASFTDEGTVIGFFRGYQTHFRQRQSSDLSRELSTSIG